MLEIKDHRKFLEKKLQEAKEAEAAKPQPLLEQSKSQVQTGDPRLDKFLRVLTAKIEKDEAHARQVALNGIANPNPEVRTVHHSEFMFVQGRLSAFKEMLKVPEEIIFEERGGLKSV